MFVFCFPRLSIVCIPSHFSILMICFLLNCLLFGICIWTITLHLLVLCLLNSFFFLFLCCNSFNFFSSFRAALISLSFSALNMNSSDFTPAMIGSVPSVTHLIFSLLHYAIHFVEEVLPICLAITTFYKYVDILMI